MKRILCLLAITLLHAALPLPSAAAPANHIGLNDVIATVEKSFKPANTGVAPISTFAANFFQRTTLASDRREMRAEGQVTVRLATDTTPLMYHFEYFRPARQEIISDGKVLWIYHPENREVILSDVSFLYNRSNFNPDRDRAINLLDGLGRISKDFQINFASGVTDSAGNYVLELTPRRSMLNTRRILLLVDKNSVISYVGGTTAGMQRTMPNTAPSPRLQGSLPQPRSSLGTQPPFGSTQSDPFPLLSTTVYDHGGNSTTMEFTNIQVNGFVHDSSFTFIVPGDIQIVRPSEQNLPR